MLSARDSANRVWSGRCDGCLEVILPFRHGERADVERELVADGWELDGQKIWCVDCSRRRREVPFPLTRRGARGKRR